ncbi:MAG: lysylphosphatidylglycerol synthase transmembrane domain-containing protein [Pirellulaceae bacterium]
MSDLSKTNHALKKWLLAIVKFGLPIGIVWYLLAAIEPEQWSALRESPKQWTHLAIALLVGLTSIGLCYVRWWMLVRAHRIELSPIEGIRLGAIGFLLNFVSVGAVGGDLFKAYFLARRSPGKRIEVFATVLVDRIIGLYGLLVVASIALLLIGSTLTGDDIRWIRIIVFGSCVGGAVGMAGLLVGGKFVDRGVDAIARVPLVGAFVHRIADPLRAFRHHTLIFFIAIGMSVVIHVLSVVAVYFIATGLYPAPPTLREHMLIVPMANAVAGLPISLAGIGVFEGVLSHMYEIVPANPSNASGTIVGLVYEIVKIAIAAIGIVFYWTGGRDIQETARSTT